MSPEKIVTPAKAGVHALDECLDSGLRRKDTIIVEYLIRMEDRLQTALHL